MEARGVCCGYFWKGKKMKKKTKGEALGSSCNLAVVKRISNEQLRSCKSAHGCVENGGEEKPAVVNDQYRPLSGSNGSLDESLCSNETVQDDSQSSEELRAASGFGVKETSHEFRSQDADGNKMINEYVRKGKIGTGSYGKVVLYKKDEKLFAIKTFHKSRLSKLRVSPTETALMDVHREVAIMKRLDHPNIVRLYEIIDDPQSNNLYLVLEYMEHNQIFKGCGPQGGIGKALARKYFQDTLSGLLYLHNHNIVHGDIKPENLLLSRDGCIKICDFGVSRMFEGENDELQRSPGTPVYTAPECCSGLSYRGRAADVWALGCTLYCMIFGRYPFAGDGSFPSIYDEIVNQPLFVPKGVNGDLADLLHGILCKDVHNRMSLAAVAAHPWTNNCS